jgi:hypothetical protein
MARFGEACRREPLVVAAWLGGSFPAGRATEASDVDVYAVSDEPDYQLLLNRRRGFVAAMGTPERQDDHPNFESLGFDLVHFELEDGVSGEIAFGHTGNFLTLHGGRTRCSSIESGCSTASGSRCSDADLGQQSFAWASVRECHPTPRALQLRG